MATLDITSTTKTNFKIRLEYTAGNGAISITNIGGCRTDGYDSASQNSQNRVNISIGGNSASKTPSSNTVRFTKNSNYSYWGVGHTVSGLNGNTSISVSVYTPSNSTINGLTFNTTINAGTSATAPTGVWCAQTGVTETAISVNGGYSSDGGSAITTSGYQFRTATGSWTNSTHYVDGLQPDTQYYMRYYVGNAIGTTYSSEVGIKTYKYPYIISVSKQELTIGESQFVIIYNPLWRNVTIKMNKGSASGTLLYSATTEDLTHTFTPNANTLYSSIPNNTNATCVYSVVYGNITRSTTGTYKYKIKNDGTEIPTFDASKWSYTANLTQLTNNNQCVIDGYSTVTYTLNSQATSNYGATISKYNYKWGNKSTVSTSGSTVVGGNGTTLTVDAVDSRGLLKSTTKSLISGQTYVPYTLPTLDYSNTSTRRVDGVTATTYLDVKGKLSVTKFGTSGVDNALYSVKYKVYNYSTGSWTSQFTIPTSEFTLASDGTFTLDDYLIHADGSSGGFTVGTKYAIQLEIKDAQGLLGTLTSSNILVTDGKLARDVYQDSNGEYHQGINGLADSNYANKIYGSEKVTGNIDFDSNSSHIYWKEQGYGDKFQIIPNFSGTDDSNTLKIQSAVGGAGTDPSLYDIATISGKSGNGWLRGYLLAEKGFYSLNTGNVGTPVGNGRLIIKRATNTEAPNNGCVLEYGNSTSWVGQLWIPDNGETRPAISGWYNGTRSAWKNLAFQSDLNKHICIAYYTANKQINEAYVYPTLDASKVVGSKLTLSGGKIKVGAGVSKVKISACAFLENVNSSRFGYIWMFVYKNNNSTSVASAIMSGVPNYYQTIAITDIVVDVAQNDTLYLGFNNPTSSNPATIRNGINNTRLYVEVVE